jgi:outer membrane receptor protein involved in Fe transport
MMQVTRPLSRSALFSAVRRALFAALMLTSPAWAGVDDAAEQDTSAPPAQADPKDATSAGTDTGNGVPEGSKPSLMGEIKVVGYRTKSATSATGVITDIIDTPISISAINDQFISDIGASQSMEAIGSLTGVTGQSNSGETQTNFSVRGYQVTPQVDGFGSLAYISGLGSTVGIDRIEVLKGPSAVFNGNVPPGGSINIIYKKPTFTSNTTYFEGEIGSWSYRSGEVFSSGPINDKFAYLVDIYKKDSDGWVDWTEHNEKTAILGATFRPTDTLSLNLNYRRIDNDARLSTLPVSHEGFIGSGLPQDTYLDAWVAQQFGPNEPPQTITVAQYLPGGERYNVLGPQNYNRETLRLWSGEISWQVNEHVEIRDDFAKTDYSWGLLGLLQSGAKVLGPDGRASTFFGTSGLLAGEQEGSGWENKLEAVFYFDTGFISHSTLVGYQASGSKIDVFKAWVGPGQVNSEGQPWDFFSDGPILLQNQFDALRAISPTPNYANQRDVGQVLTHAFYIAEQMSMFDDRLHVLIGARHTKTSNDGLGVSDTTPQFGIIGKPFAPDSFFADTAFFANYSKSFTPSGLVQPGTTQVVPPAKGTGKEFGVKTAWLDGAVTSTISFFRDDLANIATPDYSHQGQGDTLVLYNLGGVGRAQGMEAEVTWTPTKTLQLSANVTNLAVAKYLKYPGVPQQVGLRFGSSPRQQANLTAKYTFDEGALAGLYLGGWIHAQTGTRGTLGGDWHYDVQLPGLTQVSAFAGYKVGHLDMRLNIDNLTDRGGYVMNNVFQPQSPRAYYLTVKYTL